MARTSKSKSKSAVPQYKKCGSCPPATAVKPVSAFYRSMNPMHLDGYVPICKECVMNMSYSVLEHKVSLYALRKLLRQIDFPYSETLLHSAAEEYRGQVAGTARKPDDNKRIVAYYMKSVLSLKQYRGMDFADGERWWKEHEIPPGSTFADDPDVLVDCTDDNFVFNYMEQATPEQTRAANTAQQEESEPVDEEAVMLFGEGFKPNMYRKFMKKFNWLKQSYVDVTNFHTEALATYTRYKVLEEDAIAFGDAELAKQWGTLANKASENAKINPKQMSRSDLNSGISSFSEISQAVEQAVDVIPILPQFRYKPNDAVDFLIWQYVNYVRRLEGKPECTYEEVYKFYDDRVADYLKQYGDPTGIFTEDPTKRNREQITKFIQLPNDDNDIKADSADPEEVVLGD